MTAKKFPFRSSGDLPKELIAYLEEVGKPAGAVADASGTAAITASAPSSSAISSVATTGSTDSTPFGYTTSDQADAIVTAINLMITAISDLRSVVTTLRSDVTSNAAITNTISETLNDALASLRARGQMES